MRDPGQATQLTIDEQIYAYTVDDSEDTNSSDDFSEEEENGD